MRRSGRCRISSFLTTSPNGSRYALMFATRGRMDGCYSIANGIFVGEWPFHLQKVIPFLCELLSTWCSLGGEKKRMMKE